LITNISVVGIAVTTAALVILIAAFNGIESMVEQLYSEYDSNLTIRSAKGKSFDEKTLDLKKIKSIPEVSFTSRALEEIVVIKNEQKWANARMIGVDPDFLKIAKVPDHLVDGISSLGNPQQPRALIGATLLDKLDGYIPKMEGDFERVDVYFPKRNAKVSALSNPFRNQIIAISGRVNYNREVNQEAFIIPIDLAREMLDYDQNMTALFVNLKDKSKAEKVKKIIQEKLGDQWVVKTHLEKNALIYQTSKSEKLIVIGILVFIFIMAAFNLVASLTMLYIEKKDNIKTMQSFGANQRFIFRIFFYEGLLISAKGIISGLIIGYVVCATQIYGAIIKMPNSGGEAFPINITWKDGALVLILVSTLSILASYIPVKFLTRNKS
jgi:lipoprotein-releasing system permease protein